MKVYFRYMCCFQC